MNALIPLFMHEEVKQLAQIPVESNLDEPCDGDVDICCSYLPTTRSTGINQ